VSAGVAVLAMVAELATGYPDRLFRVVGHPVSWAGRLIAALERRLNDKGLSERRRRANGVGALAVVVLASGAAGWLAQRLASGWVGLLVVAGLAGTLIAQRSLATHVAAVARGLDSGIHEGRGAVAMIVGRDTGSLDEAGVARAAVESLAENFADGVVAPVFWLAVAGLPGAAAYKAVNTADSMIGHRTPRHRAFGWAAARLDDLVNLPASRLAALLLVAAAALLPGASASGAWRAVRRDAGRHRSPNAGWPEAALAGALGFALAGPRRYGGVLVEDAVMGAGGRRALGATDIRRALRLYWVADALLVALLGAVALVTWPS
jgi:adenosylcobinamide-phosphate synthase